MPTAESACLGMGHVSEYICKASPMPLHAFAIPSCVVASFHFLLNLRYGDPSAAHDSPFSHTYIQGLYLAKTFCTIGSRQASMSLPIPMWSWFPFVHSAYIWADPPTYMWMQEARFCFNSSTWRSFLWFMFCILLKGPHSRLSQACSGRFLSICEMTAVTCRDPIASAYIISIPVCRTRAASSRPVMDRTFSVSTECGPQAIS